MSQQSTVFSQVLVIETHVAQIAQGEIVQHVEVINGTVAIQREIIGAGETEIVIGHAERFLSGLVGFLVHFECFSLPRIYVVSSVVHTFSM